MFDKQMRDALRLDAEKLRAQGVFVQDVEFYFIDDDASLVRDEALASEEADLHTEGLNDGSQR